MDAGTSRAGPIPPRTVVTGGSVSHGRTAFPTCRGDLEQGELSALHAGPGLLDTGIFRLLHVAGQVGTVAVFEWDVGGHWRVACMFCAARRVIRRSTEVLSVYRPGRYSCESPCWPDLAYPDHRGFVCFADSRGAMPGRFGMFRTRMAPGAIARTLTRIHDSAGPMLVKRLLVALGSGSIDFSLSR